VGVNVKMTDANDGVVYIDTKRTKRPIAFTYERRPLIPPVCPALEEGVRTMRRGGVRVVTAKSKNVFGDRYVYFNSRIGNWINVTCVLFTAALF